MTSSRLASIRIRRPAELIEGVPYLLGFHPENSLVLVGFDDAVPGHPSTSRVTVTARIDLPLAGAEFSSEGTASLCAALSHAAAESAAIVLYVSDNVAARSEIEEWTPRITPVTTALTESGIDVVDVLVASPKRWWSLPCTDSDCCPVIGSARELETSVTAVEAVAAGLWAARDRAGVATVLDGPPDHQRQGFHAHLEAAENRLTDARLGNRLRRELQSDLREFGRAAAELAQDPVRTGSPSAPLPKRRVARLAVALTETVVRDEIWTAIDDGSAEPTALLLEMIRRLPAPYIASPLFLYAWQQWRAGSGTLAMIAAERALVADPTYSAAELLLRTIAAGLDPRTTPPLADLTGPARGNDQSGLAPGMTGEGKVV